MQKILSKKFGSNSHCKEIPKKTSKSHWGMQKMAAIHTVRKKTKWWQCSLLQQTRDGTDQICQTDDPVLDVQESQNLKILKVELENLVLAVLLDFCCPLLFGMKHLSPIVRSQASEHRKSVRQIWQQFPLRET